MAKAGIGAAAVCYRNIDADSVPVWTLMALGVFIVTAGVATRIIIVRRSASVE